MKQQNFPTSLDRLQLCGKETQPSFYCEFCFAKFYRTALLQNPSRGNAPDRSSHHKRCSTRKLFLKFHNIHRKAPVLEFLFNINKTPTQVFSCDIAKFEEHLFCRASANGCFCPEALSNEYLSRILIYYSKFTFFKFCH